MTSPDLTALADRLGEIDGVQRAFIEAGPPVRVYLICQVGPPERAELEARALLARAGLTPGRVELHTASLAAPQPRRRARLVSVGYEETRPGAGLARVRLEWNDVEHEGTAGGESGPVAPLRLVARATLGGLESVLDGAIRFDLVGVKGLRIFDRDLVVALIRGSEASEAPFAGASLVADDLARSACLAVLNATNRLLGNYLSVSD